MSAVKFVISIALMIVFLYFTVTSVQRLMVASEEVDKAQKAYDIAVAENTQAQKEFQNVLNEPALKTQSNLKDPSMPGCTVTGEDNTGKANSWSCP